MNTLVSWLQLRARRGNVAHSHPGQVEVLDCVDTDAAVVTGIGTTDAGGHWEVDLRSSACLPEGWNGTRVSVLLTPTLSQPEPPGPYRPSRLLAVLDPAAPYIVKVLSFDDLGSRQSLVGFSWQIVVEGQLG